MTLAIFPGTMPGVLVRRLISLVLLTFTVGMGPGLTLAEARAHAAADGPGHGRREHFEARGGQDHDDQCAVGIAAPLARGSLAPSPVFRLPRGTFTRFYSAAPPEFSSAPTLLPPSRAPPPSQA